MNSYYEKLWELSQNEMNECEDSYEIEEKCCELRKKATDIISELKDANYKECECSYDGQEFEEAVITAYQGTWDEFYSEINFEDDKESYEEIREECLEDICKEIDKIAEEAVFEETAIYEEDEDDEAEDDDEEDYFGEDSFTEDLDSGVYNL